jgi:hypothetical protein
MSLHVVKATRGCLALPYLTNTARETSMSAFSLCKILTRKKPMWGAKTITYGRYASGFTANLPRLVLQMFFLCVTEIVLIWFEVIAKNDEMSGFAVSFHVNIGKISWGIGLFFKKMPVWE